MLEKMLSYLIIWIILVLLISSCQPKPVEEQNLTQPFDSAVLISTSTKTPKPTRTPKPTLDPLATKSLTPTEVPQVSPLWTFPTQGEVWASPAFEDGVIYFGSDDHFLYAVDTATQQLKWKFETGDMVRSRPAVVDGTVYFTSDDDTLYALEIKTGEVIWRFDLGKSIRIRGSLDQFWDYMQSSPAVVDGVVYVGSGNSNFYAVDAKTGLEKWHFAVNYLTRSSPAVKDGVVFVGDMDRYLYAIDAQSGQEKWRFNMGSAVVPSPTVVDGVVYVGSKAPFVYALDAQSGQEIWRFPYPPAIAWVESSAAVANGMVYVGSSDWRRMNAIDAKTGELIWFLKTKGFPWCSPAVADGVVYIGGTGGFFYATDAATGRELWKLQTGDSLSTVTYGVTGGIVSSPVVAENVVYFGSLDGKLYAVSTNQ